MFNKVYRRNMAPIILTLIVIIVLIFLPTKFPQKLYENSERVSARILSTDESYQC